MLPSELWQALLGAGLMPPPSAGTGRRGVNAERVQELNPGHLLWGRKRRLEEGQEPGRLMSGSPTEAWRGFLRLSLSLPQTRSQNSTVMLPRCTAWPLFCSYL